MSDPRHDLARDLGREAMTAGAKLTAGPGVLAYGAWSLNDVALLIGILASAAIFVHTALKIVWDWRDRRSLRAGAGTRRLVRRALIFHCWARLCSRPWEPRGA